uniref:Trans-1,2-dihydrobenzene-1,2-diol dehydrogenase n=1 Tax=Heliothis virescens TaxID=7102 RepID=A0A2A4K2G4_HELVI
MTLRWGIVSAGKICSDFVNAFNSYGDKGDQAIVAVAARDKTKAKEFAKNHNISLYFGSYQEMASSSDIDVVYIGALNPYHFDLAKLYLTNGKHVLCEKPLCMNKCQVASLIDIARKERRFLMEAIWSRFSPAYLEMEKEIKSGKIGEVQFLEANFGFYSESDRIIKKEYGGSAVLDVGVYLLQLAVFVFKEIPKSVNVFGSLNVHGVDTAETIVLEYRGGKRAVLNSHTQLELCNQATVYGTKGRITLQAPFHFPDKMISSDGTVKSFELHRSKYPYNFQNSAGLVYEMLEVARCIKEDVIESSRMTHDESILISTLQDSIRNKLGVQFQCDDTKYPCSFINIL